jgi:Acetyltransferase (GNAT) family
MNTLQFSISPYEPHHRDTLLEFRTAHYEAGSFRTDPAYVDWLFLDPFQSQPGRPSLYVCEDGQRIIGTQGLLHVRLKAGTEKVSAAWVAEFAVRKELQRGSGIGSALARVSRNAMKIRMAIDVSGAAVPLAIRDGWQHVCSVPLWVRPLDARQASLRRARWLAKLGLTVIAQAALNAILNRALRIARRRHFQLVSTEVFDERVDAVWARVAAEYAVICERNSAYMRWRFDRFPGGRSYERFWLKDDKEIVGYVVLRIGDHNGLRSAFIIDYLCQPAATSSLMALALDICRSRKAVLAYCLNLNPWANAIFRPLAFLRRKSGYPFMVYTKESPSEVAQFMSDVSNWFVTLADSNLDHLRALEQSKSIADLS